MLTYLWKTYQKAPDTKFVEYIHGLCNHYVTGKSDFTAQELMNLAEVMNKAQMQMNEWSSLLSEQEEIVALNAKIAHLDKQLEQVNKSKTKTKEENKNKNKNNDQDREWMKEKPKGNEKKVRGHPTQTKGKKTYFWCPHHNNEQGQWVIHDPDECKNKHSMIMENKETIEHANLAAHFDAMKKNDVYTRVAKSLCDSGFHLWSTYWNTYSSSVGAVVWSYQQCLMLPSS